MWILYIGNCFIWHLGYSKITPWHLCLRTKFYYKFNEDPIERWYKLLLMSWIQICYYLDFWTNIMDILLKCNN